VNAGWYWRYGSPSDWNWSRPVDGRGTPVAPGSSEVKDDIAEVRGGPSGGHVGSSMLEMLGCTWSWGHVIV
jgi:hypothetical protein